MKVESTEIYLKNTLLDKDTLYGRRDPESSCPA